MKLLTRFAIGAAVLVVAGLVVLFVYIDQIASSAIEKGASYALGVDTDVGFVRIGFLTGTVRTGGLDIANPPGFTNDDFLTVDSSRLEVSLESLRKDTVVVSLMAIDGVEVALEQGSGQTNYGTILANLKRFEKAGSPAPEKSTGPGKTFVVKEVRITDVTAHLVASAALGDAGKMDVTIPEIILRDLGAGGGLEVGQLANVLLKAVLGAVARNGGDIPGAVLGQLSSGLRSLGPVSSQVVTNLAGSTGSDALDGAARAAGESVGKATSERAEEALRGLGGLFGGDED